MGIRYTNEKIIQKVKNALPNVGFYGKDFVNYTSKTKDGDFCTEVIAKYLLENKSEIVPYSRLRKNFQMGERGCEEVADDTERGLCRRWYCEKDFDEDLPKVAQEYLGTPFECELNISPYTGVDVDLISYHEKKDVLYLIEVKGVKKDGEYKSVETLLKCALQIQTYYESLIQKEEQLLKDLHIKKLEINPYTRIRKVILIPEDSTAAMQFENEEHPNVNQLIDDWDIEVFIFKKDIK